MKALRPLAAAGCCGLLAVALIMEPPPTDGHAGRGYLPEAEDLWARALGPKARSPSPGLLVSRYAYRLLPRFRGWQDLKALRAYVAWADRAEAVGVREGEILADVSEYDLILLREPCAAVAVQAPAGRACDPVGWTVIDPRNTGWVRIRWRRHALQAVLPALSLRLPRAPLPSIRGAWAAAGNVVEIYGEFLSGTNVRVRSRQGEGTLLYMSAKQVNAELPSLDEVQLERDGLPSEWAPVERRRP